MCNHPSVSDCYYITGDFDYIARIGVGTTEELTKVLHNIKEIPGVSLTRTFVVLDNVKQSVTGASRLQGAAPKKITSCLLEPTVL